MKFKKKVLISLVLSALLIIAACAQPAVDTSADEDTADAEEVIKFGYIGPLTGGLASIGNSEKNVIEMYLDLYPEWDGKTVEVVFEDGRCEGQPAANAAQKLVNVDNVEVILGGGCSGETLAAAPITETGEVLLFSSLSTSPEVTDAGDFVFRNAPSDESTTDVMAETIAEQYTKVAMISELNDFAQAFRESVLPKLEEAGVEIVLDETFNSETTDFKTVLQKVADSDADVILSIPGDSSAGGFITKQAVEQGLDLPIYGPDTLTGSEYLEIAGDSANGTYAIVTSADRTRDDVLNFFDDYESQFGELPPAEAYALMAYDRMVILQEAVEEVGYDATALRDWLYQMDTYDGLAGATEFDENGDSSIVPMLMVYEDDELVKAE